MIGALSGGKDSWVTCQVLADRGELDRVVHFDTGIAIPDLISHLDRETQKRKWEFLVCRTPIRYDDLVRKYGFPGPPMHTVFMSALKGRCMREVHRKFPRQIVASGVRRRESQRRWANVKARGKWEGVEMVAPIAGWTNQRVWEFVRKRELPLSPAYGILGISGDCLCGAYARRCEARQIRKAWPDMAARILQLEQETSDRWGGMSGFKGDIDQTDLEEWFCGGCAVGQKAGSQ